MKPYDKDFAEISAWLIAKRLQLFIPLNGAPRLERKP